jgi:hypothetical protein
LKPLPNSSQSDDEDSNGNSCIGHPYTSNVLGAKRYQLKVEADCHNIEMENSHLGMATTENDEGLSPWTSNKPFQAFLRIKAGQIVESEYFSPSGIKLKVTELPVKHNTKEWLKHVEECPKGSRSLWHCTWQTMNNGTPIPCKYLSKKHLIKQHIEARHLCIKYVLTKFGWCFFLMR